VLVTGTKATHVFGAYEGSAEGIEVRCSDVRRVFATGASLEIGDVLVVGGSGGLVYGTADLRHVTVVNLHSPEGILQLGPYTVADSVFDDGENLFRTTKSNTVTATRSVWYDIANPFPDGGAPSSGLTEVDPMLSTAGDPCAEGYWPMYGSPLVDAGDPGDVDLDGSAADIGASGGSTAIDFVPDVDEDGVNASRDCDDHDASRRPNSPDSVGDGFDQNCDDLDGTDADLDGHASASSGGDDCADTDPSRYPGATDTIGDTVDSDCDGTDGVDGDGDRHADADFGGDDCDDADATSYPGAPDLAGNSVDNDCDGVDGVDADGDGFASVTSGGDDCDDAANLTFPGTGDQVGDGIDRNCDGSDGTDADADDADSEASGGDDCLDTDATVHPGATDTFGDAVDQDCSGADGEDSDGDGHASEASGGDDCADDDPLAHPGATEDKGGEDLDCDGKPSVGCGGCASSTPPRGVAGLGLFAAGLLLRRRGATACVDLVR